MSEARAWLAAAFDPLSPLGLFRRGASGTAEAVAFQRAVELVRPAGDRVIEDPFAQHFLGPPLHSALVMAHRLGSAALDLPAFLPALTTYVVCRHRFIDDGVLGAVRGGARQLVVLGAGYDARALRFARLLQQCTVFELDQRPTQRRKRRILERTVGRLPEGLTFVTIDFERQSIAAALEGAGFDRRLPTVFVWEGVSMYLTRSAVEGVLRTVAALAPPGSCLLLDLWNRAPGASIATRAWDAGGQLLRFIGEPLRFSMPPAAVSEWVEGLGYHLRDHAVGVALRERYVSSSRAMYEGCSLVHLEVQ